MAFSEIALKALQDVVGEENASDDPVLCQAYSRVQWTADGCIQRNEMRRNAARLHRAARPPPRKYSPFANLPTATTLSSFPAAPA